MGVFILCTVVRWSAILHRDVIHCPSVYLTSAGCSQEEGNPCLCRCRQSLSDCFEEAAAISIRSLFKTWLSRRGGLRVSSYLGNNQRGWLRKAEVKDGGEKTITTDMFLFVCQRAAAGRVHAKEAPVQGALPAPLLLLQDPRPQTRLHCSLRPLPPLADAHHCRQELPGEWYLTGGRGGI